LARRSATCAAIASWRGKRALNHGVPVTKEALRWEIKKRQRLIGKQALVIAMLKKPMSRSGGDGGGLPRGHRLEKLYPPAGRRGLRRRGYCVAQLVRPVSYAALNPSDAGLLAWIRLIAEAHS